MGISAMEKHKMRVSSLTVAQGRVNPLFHVPAEQRQVCQNPSGISVPSQGKATLPTLLGGPWLLRPRPSQELPGFAAPPCPAFFPET